MKVFVYYNLHKHVWSIKALEGPQKGKIVAYRDEVWLKDALPVVSASGRERVRREQQKNVHAGIAGEWITRRSFTKDDIIDKITYNPYKYDTFVSVDDDQKEYTGSRMALMWQKQVWSIDS